MIDETKQKAIDILRRRYEQQWGQLAAVDPRLLEYYDHMLNHVSAEQWDEHDRYNLFEVLCAVRFLRFLRTYPFNTKKVRHVIRLREGNWRQLGDMWQYVDGGIKCPGTGGARVYRWEPFQVFVLASVFGFHAWIDTQLMEGDRPLLKTEEVRGGHIYDLRRLCTDFTFYAPRKSDKTGLAAFIQIVFFLLEDDNSEVYCCANSSDQAKLLYRRTRQMLAQIDNGNRIRMTETVCDWRQAWKSVRDSSIRPLSAGGKTKDGMFAQLCCADEYGSAPYINGKSDMKMLVDVVTSSMGPRREPLTFTTTTAGRISAGPFIEKLDSLHRLLMKEIDIDEGKEEALLSNDRTSCILFEPDEWEKTDEDYLLTSKAVRAKVNRMLGIIVQHQFYDDEAAKARMTGDTGEFISKYLNVYQSATVKEWMKPDDIRQLQTDMRIDDCTDAAGWMVFAGLDFSKGDDLNGVSYLAVNTRTGEFFGDMDSYVSEEAVAQSPIRELMEKWNDDGWLHIVPGKTFDPSWPVNRIIELHNKGVNFMMFLYDPYNARIVMNALGSWVFDLGLDPKQIIVPAKQNFATYNSVVNEFDYMCKRSLPDESGNMVHAPMIHLSMNPLWPYEFGCCMLAESTDGMENRKPVKANSGGATKVDNVQMLLSALMGYDMMEGSVSE